MAASNTAYDLTMFNAIPLPEHQPQEMPHIVNPRPPKSKQQLKRETRLATVTAIKVISVAVLLLSLFGGIIASRVSLTLKQRSTEELKEQLEIANSENIRLNMKIDTMLSDETIDNYAVNVLGLKKVENYQIHYFENETTDKAVVFGGSD